MILGVGVDICSVARIGELRKRYGARFLDRIFSPLEQQYCGLGPGCDERYAARFAAKEAFAKALGSGFAQGLTMRQIEVAHAPGGRPSLHVTDRAQRLAAERGVTAIHLSLAHEREHAVAFVVLEH